MNERNSGLQRFRNLSLNRRDVLSKMAVGLCATATPALLRSTPALAETPKRGGHARIAWFGHSASDTLDPGKLTSSLDFFRAYSVGSPLVRWNRRLEPTPDLAVEWEATPDLKTWHFRLRKGVEFHDGRSLSSRDVVSSIQYHIGPDSKSIIKPWLEEIESIEADGDDLVKITLQSPNADLPMYLGDSHTVIFPDGFRDFDKFIGTGPFKNTGFRPGVGMTLARNENYYNAANIWLDEVETFGIGDTAARTNALMAGDVHFIVRVDPKTIDLLHSRPDISIEPTKCSRHITFPTMADREPFTNLDLRLALKWAADRNGMVQNVLKGFGLVGNDVPLSPLDRYYCKELQQRDYDLDKARFHYAKSGYTGVLELNTSEAAGGTIGPDLASHLAESAAKAGINIRVIRKPSDGYWSTTWLKEPFHTSNWQPRPTADLRFSLTNLSTAPWNEGGYRDPKVDALILEARGTADGPKRYELYCELQKILWDKDGRIIPLFADFIDARSTKLMGYKPHPFGEAGGSRMLEDVWLEE